MLRDAVRATPPYRVGDRRYVRETYFGNYYLHPNEPPDEREIPHCTDDNEDFKGERIVWRPGIHMPKCAARVCLEVTAVRAERLQNITYEYAIAERAINDAEAISRFDPPGKETGDDTARRLKSPRRDFALLSDERAKPGTLWANEPWVWVVEFRRVEYQPKPTSTEIRGPDSRND